MLLYLASKNQNKLREIKDILGSNYDIKLWNKEIEETGKTFLENARIKALTVSKEIENFVISDDSGLVVPLLKGAPGIYSARYAGLNATSEERIDKLLNELLPFKYDLFGNLNTINAYFVCSVVLAKKGNVLFETEEFCHGQIIFEKLGNQGFGYDPIFYIKELNKTMAQLSTEEKNKISHRGKAFNKLKNFLELINEK